MISSQGEPTSLAAIELPPEEDDPALETRRLLRRMNGRPVLNRIDVAISRGEIVSLLGANGAGKTTLLRCLSGQLRPTSGEVLWFGDRLNHRPASHRLAGYAGHETGLYSELTAKENLLFAARMYGISQAEQRVAGLLNKIGLQARAGQLVGSMSKGMRQRLSLARALVHDPPIVILDEPFSGLDVCARQWLEEWLCGLRERRCAICFTSHDEQQCRRIANRVLELRNGNLHE